MKKVIVIGSGLGGLTTAAVLAKNGYEVLVLEQGTQVGGCLQCFKRGGAKFETGMHFIGSADPGQVLHKMMRYLEIDTQVPLSRLDTRRYNVVSLAGQHFDFANGKEAFVEQMASYFPGQMDNLVRYCRLVDSISTASALHSLQDATSDQILNAKCQLLPMSAVLEELFTDRLLQQVLAGDLPLYAAERDKTPFSTHAFIMDFYNQSSFRVAGGSDAVATALVSVIQRYGGEVRVRCKATRIVCDASKAIGVEVGGDHFVAADYVVSAIHPMRTIELLGDTKLIRPAFRTRIAHIPQTVGCLSVYLDFKQDAVPYMNHNFFGYAGETPWGCEQYDDASWPKGFLYMHFCENPAQPFARSGVIISYMRMEELERWQHTRVGHRGKDYESFVHARALRLIQAVDKQCPGLEKGIAKFYTSTPLTYRDYTGTEGGSLYGVAKDVSLGAAGRVPHKTRIPNLFMAGQNVNSHGMLGCMVGTIVVCSEFLTSEYLYKQILEANG